MKNPIKTSTLPFKNRDPKKYPNSGVHMKFIIKLVEVNLTFLKLSFNFPRGTSRNNPKSIRHRNMFIKYPVFCAITSIFENMSPIITAEKIIIGSSFSISSIYSPFLGMTKFVYSNI